VSLFCAEGKKLGIFVEFWANLSAAPLSYAKIRHRLFEGRPLVVDADPAACLRQRAEALGRTSSCGGAGPIVVHQDMSSLREHHLAEIESRVDVLCALTSDTTPRALAELGMEHRAARLTGKAVDLALELAEHSSRPVAVAGVLGSETLSATGRGRFEEEIQEHASRIAVAGAEMTIVQGMGSFKELYFAVSAAVSQRQSTWAVLDDHLCESDLQGTLHGLRAAGAEAIIFEVRSVDEGLKKLAQVAEMESQLVLGTFLSAAPDALRGYPSSLFSSWVDRVVELIEAGARIVGGGAGTTEAHTRALVARLGTSHPSMVPPSLQTASSSDIS